MTTSKKTTTVNKNDSFDGTSQDQAGTNPDNYQPSDDDSKSVPNLAETVVSPKQLSIKEEKLATVMGELLECEKNIDEMRASITSPTNKMPPIAKAKIRNDIRLEMNKKKILKAQISKLSKELKKEYQKNARSFTRRSLRVSARKVSYHKRHGNSVRMAITKMIAALDKDDFNAIKSELANLSGKDADALIMKSLLKAPRFLHTKVVANPVAREEYLQHFRDELGVTSKKSKRGRRRK